MKITWVCSICVYLLVFLIGLYTSFVPLWVILASFFALMIFSSFFVLKHLLSRIWHEEKTYKDVKWENLNVFIIVVEKNEGAVIFDAVDHYLSFPDNVKMRIYDDNSTDGTYEKLIEKSKEYPGRIDIVRLKKADRVIHPKGRGIEDAFHSIESDYFFIIDADSRVSFEDFKKGLFAAKNQNIDVVHLTRRNDTANNVGYRIGDADELMMTGMKIINLIPWVFSGSGFFIKGEVAKKFSYEKDVFSEDTEMGKYLRRNGYKIEYFITLPVHERAPSTLGKSFKQRINWLKMGIPHYLKEEKIAVLIGNFVFASFTYLPIFIYSIPSLIVIGLGGFIFGLVFTTLKIVGKKSFLQSVFDTFIYIAVEYVTFAFIYPVLFFSSPWRSVKFVKNAS
ncbi:glycosyltransferase [Athalassotoga saccharophila]|uniref:glycosyltransferase n=1 Tax=Athalassotoga saccharophila TaxID=1441386 RepID=UPI00137AD605|nr:glycosyltransferase family 2 protein [Athalassotoga saccharophila]BBJ27239.1 glycosyl transferase family 2 [Athalassotoga saccharophila]